MPDSGRKQEIPTVQIQKFEKGNSIHAAERITYFADVVGAGDWQLKVARQGLELEWEGKAPGRYREPNNKSAVKHMELVKEKVEKWMADGQVEMVDEQPWCTNPLSVAVKYDPVTDSTKFRPVIDLSRHVNKFAGDIKVKLDDLKTSEGLIRQGDFMASFDLENQFFHVHLDPRFRKYFGFALPKEGGGEQFYRFTVMAYGYKPAVGVVTRMLQPVKAYLHKKGVALTMYVDDGRVAAATAGETMRHLALALEVVQNCGWNVQWAKTSTEAEQRHLHLGFFTDSLAMRYFYPEEKQEVVLKQLKKIVAGAAAGERVTCREMAQALGRLNSMRTSHGNIVGVMSRSCQHQLGCVVMDEGWEATVRLGADAVEELGYLVANLAWFNGQHMQTVEARTKVMSLVQRDKECLAVEGTEENMENLFVSGVTDSHAFVYRADGTFRYVLDVEFAEDKSAVASGFRELSAVSIVFSRDPDQFRQCAGGRVYWQTDSYSCFMYLKKGSRIPCIQRKVAEIKRMERSLDLELVPVWTPRTQARLVLADLGSKLSQSTDEWGVHRDDLGEIFRDWGFWPEVDCMAAGNNSICREFFSLVPQVGARGVNFFCQQLEPGKKFFCCPPVKQIVRAVGHILQQKGVQGVLAVPAWESTPFWSVLDREDFRSTVSAIRDYRARFITFNSAPGSVFARCNGMMMRFFILKLGKDSCFKHV